jgi:predicted transporter
MKNVSKVVTYSFVTLFVVVMSQFSAVAASNKETNALSTGQVIGGIALLIAAILVPTLRSARKAKAGKL